MVGKNKSIAGEGSCNSLKCNSLQDLEVSCHQTPTSGRRTIVAVGLRSFAGDPCWYKARIHQSSRLLMIYKDHPFCPWLASSGVRDDISVAHWGDVYKSAKYRAYGLKEYAGMMLEEYAAIARNVTKKYQNSNYILPMYRHLWRRKKGVPKSAAEMMCFYGFDLKSAVLILQILLCCRTRDVFGIAVD
jgi:hypothetical protein